MKAILMIILILPYLFNSAQTPNDPKYADQWNLLRKGTSTSDVGINALDAWGLSTGNGVKVGVIHYGFWLNAAEANYDAFTWDGTSNSSPAVNQSADNGSLISSVINAKRNNDKCITGIAFNSKVIALTYDIASTIQVRNQSYKSCMEKAIEKNVDVILLPIDDILEYNTPAGSGTIISYGFQNNLNNLLTQNRNGAGAVVVFPAGDQQISSCTIPMDKEKVITVGSIIANGKLQNNANYGSCIDVVAPGQDIWGYYLAGITNPNCDKFDGSDLAAAHVAGIAALMLEILPACVKYDEIKEIICRTCTKNLDASFVFHPSDANHPYGTWNEKVGYGLVNAFAAVTEAKRIKEAYNNLIQNVTITDSRSFASLSDIRVGEEVDPTKTKLPVFFESTSNTILKASTSIKFEPGTHIKAGAKMHAYIDPYTGNGCARYVPPANKKSLSIKDNIVETSSQVQLLDTKINIYPNPVEEQINIDLNSTKDCKVNINIYNALGQTLYQKELELKMGNNKISIPNIYSDKLLITKISINNESIVSKLLNSIVK